MAYKDINLLPDKVVKDRKTRERTNMIILLSVLIVVTALSLLLIPINQMTELEASKKQYEQKIEKMLEIETLEKQLEVAQRNLLIRQKVIEAIQREEQDILFVLEQIEKITPKDLKFVSLTISGDTVNISGVTQSDVVIADFIRSMKMLNLFEDIFVPGITGHFKPNEEQSQEDKQFTLSAVLRKKNSE